MKTAFVAVGLLIAIVLYPAFQHELLRWDECFEGCRQSYANNAKLLGHRMCWDPTERKLHGHNAEKAWSRAEFENRATPVRCAWRAFWTQGELYGVYKKFAHSPWMLYGMALPLSLFIIYMVFHTWRVSSERTELLSTMREMALLSSSRPTYALEERHPLLEHRVQQPIQLVVSGRKRGGSDRYVRIRTQ